MTTESQGGEVHYDPGMHMLNSQTVQGAPRQTRVYRQVRTEAYEYFAEVKADQGLLTRLWPWRKARQVGSTPWNAEDHHLTPTQRAAESLCNFGSVLGSFVSGSLGGMAVMTLLQIYLFNINKAVQGNDLVLVYYAPIALTVNRIYWGLTMIALSSAVSRSAWMTIVLMPSARSRESLRPMAGAIQSLALPTWSMVAVIAYLVAFILNIASSGSDSDLAYAVDRDPYFHSKPLSNEFRNRLGAWRAVNTVKCICLLVAWISVVLEWQPRTLARFAKQVAHESIAGRSSHTPDRDSRNALGPDNTANRMRTLDGVEVKASEYKWEGGPSATNRLDSPRIKTNPTFQAAQASPHVTMYPSAADGMRS